MRCERIGSRDRLLDHGIDHVLGDLLLRHLFDRHKVSLIQQCRIGAIEMCDRLTAVVSADIQLAAIAIVLREDFRIIINIGLAAKIHEVRNIDMTAELLIQILVDIGRLREVVDREVCLRVVLCFPSVRDQAEIDRIAKERIQREILGGGDR